MALVHFPVTGIFQAVISDSSDPDANPDVQNVSSFVYFTPSVDQVYDTATHTVYRLQTIRARTNPDDGAVKNVDGSTVHLVANTAELDVAELTYLVTFDHVVYDKANQTLRSFRFVAPTDATPVDLADVERIPVK